MHNHLISSLKMKVIGEILTGHLFYVQVRDDATVGELKKQIGDQENLPSDRLILILDSDDQLLLDKDEAALKHYGVQDSSHIYLFFLPQDEAFSASPPTSKNSSSAEPSPNIDLSSDEKTDNEANGSPNEANHSSSSFHPSPGQ